MKRYQAINNGSDGKHVIIGSPVSAGSISFDELYGDISEHWLEKSRRLQARRWRKIKHQTA